MRVGGQRQAPAALPAGKRPGTHCGHHDRSGRVRNISPSTGIRSPERRARSKSL